MAARAVALSRDVAGGWGILGGTFDPVHFAHLAIAEQTRETLRLAGVSFVPAGDPPHKRGRPITPVDDRVEMVRLAIADNPRFMLSRVEADRPGASYTVDTLEAVSRRDPEVVRVLIVSAEALRGFPDWRRPERILELSHVAVVPRRGYGRPDEAWLAEHFPGAEDRFIFLDGPDLGHSASTIRALAAEGRSIRYLVPTAVEAYIQERKLYRPAPVTPMEV